MNPLVTVLLNVVLSAFVGGAVAIIADRAKLKDRLRIEHEYKILKQLWKKAYLLHLRTSTLRPTYRPRDFDASKDALFNEFHEAYVALVHETFANKPFYPPDIHRFLMKELNNEIVREALETRSNPDNEAAWKSADDNRARIASAVDTLCDKIRRHIHHDYADIG